MKYNILGAAMHYYTVLNSQNDKSVLSQSAIHSGNPKKKKKKIN